VNNRSPYIAELKKNVDDLVRSPNDKAKQQAAERDCQNAARVADNFKDKIKPLERAWERNKGEMQKAVEAVKRGDRPTAKKI